MQYAKKGMLYELFFDIKFEINQEFVEYMWKSEKSIEKIYMIFGEIYSTIYKEYEKMK